MCSNDLHTRDIGKQKKNKMTNALKMFCDFTFYFRRFSVFTVGLSYYCSLKHRRRNRGGRGGLGPLTFLFEGAQYACDPSLLKNAAPSLS